MSQQQPFDVFMSHNSKDKPLVRQLNAALKARGLKVWFDEEELRPGIPWQKLLEEGIKSSGSVAVLVGADGLGPWEEEEMRAALELAVREKRPIIPVLLPDAPEQPELPLFLRNRTWANMRGGFTDANITLLQWGITGVKPRGHVEPSKNTIRSPQKWVLVAGSGSHELPERLVTTCQRVGALLAEAEFGLICGGWPGVDHVVARAFAEALGNRGHIPSLFIKQVVKRGRTPDFPAGNMLTVESGDAEYQESVALADAVILIGGMGGTYGTGKTALEQGKPVFPLADTYVDYHQDAHRMFFKMIASNTWRLIPNLTLEDFQRLSEPAPGVVTTLMQLLVQCFGTQEREQPVESPESGHNKPVSHALTIWRRKLEYLQGQEAITASPAQRFELAEQIEEAKAKIVEFGG